MSTLKKYWPAAVVLLAGTLFVLLGTARGEAENVFIKAAMVCLECIGIG